MESWPKNKKMWLEELFKVELSVWGVCVQLVVPVFTLKLCVKKTPTTTLHTRHVDPQLNFEELLKSRLFVLGQLTLHGIFCRSSQM